MKLSKTCVVLFLVILGISSCKDDCASDESCPDGKVSVNEQCECPEDKIPHENGCLTKAKHSFGIIESSCDCIAAGELNLQYGPDDLENPSKWNEDGKFYTSEFAFNINGGSFGTQADYFPDSDSLYFWWFSNTSRFDCNKKSLATGKFYDDKNKLKLNVYFFEGMEGAGSQNRITDSCTLLFSNGM
jgi:hypothetical protein